MRRRVILATVSAVAVAVLLLGFPLAFLGAQLVKDSMLRELQIRAQDITRAVEGRLGREDPVTTEVLENYVSYKGQLSAHIVVVTPRGEQVSAGEPISGRVEEVYALTPSNATISIQVSYWELYFRSIQIITLVVVAAVVAVGAGIIVAIWQANRLAAPLLYLAASAEQLGSGQVDRPRPSRTHAQRRSDGLAPRRRAPVRLGCFPPAAHPSDRSHDANRGDGTRCPR